MQAVTVRDTPLLKPNAAHSNFVQTGQSFPAGTQISGEPIVVKGKRRGEDFNYRLFKCDNGAYVYISNLNPMNTEVKLGADGRNSSGAAPTKIKMPSKAIENAHLIGAILGSIAGFVVGSKTNKPLKTKIMYAIGGAAAGYVAGRLIAGQPIISVSTPAVIEKA